MNSLLDPHIENLLRELHADSLRDSERRADKPEGYGDDLVRMGDLYLSVSPEEGRLLYLLARGGRATSLVEFGASFGISTLYLGAAARDNGGRLTTTEVHPDKCKALRRTLETAGLQDRISVLEGDALETLAQGEGQVDFVFLDGWKSLYLPVLELLLPRLRPGALLVADNINYAGAENYAELVRGDTRFVSHTLGKQEISCHTG